jgi:predicted nucleotidyltransferase
MKPDDPILKRCRAILEDLYGDRLKGVILYGSTARGTDTEDSDIDLLVLLEGPVNAGEEVFRIWDVLYPAQLESDRHISVIPAECRSYQNGECLLYRNVQREGAPV